MAIRGSSLLRALDGRLRDGRLRALGLLRECVRLLRECVRLRALGLLRARGSGRPSEGRLLRGHSEDGNQETSKPQRASHRHV